MLSKTPTKPPLREKKIAKTGPTKAKTMHAAGTLNRT